MMSVRKFKVVGAISHFIGLVLSVLVFVFGIYVAISNDRVIAIIVLDTFAGITGFIFSVIGIIAVWKQNASFLYLTRSACGVTAFFAIIYAATHAMFPYYRDFYEDAYGLKNAFYLTGAGFVLLIIQSLYSLYIAHSCYRMLATNEVNKVDIEAASLKRSFDSLNRTENYSTVTDV